jgi:flagellar hook-associated protein FlgK
MRSAFFGLHVAASGLHTARGALNVTSHNIANAEIPGFTRQVAQMSAARPLVGTGRGMYGTGSQINSVIQIRDHFLDRKFWNQNAISGQFAAVNTHLTFVETVFNQLPNAGVKRTFNSFFSTTQDLTTRAHEPTFRTNVVMNAHTLTEQVRQNAFSLQRQQLDLNREFADVITTINSLGSQLADINRQIHIFERDGSNANDLRDQRALLIDRLSELVNVQVEERDFSRPGVSYDRRMTIMINGYDFVDHTRFSNLELVARENPHDPRSGVRRNAMDVGGLYDVFFAATGSRFNIHSPVLSGKLRGIVDVRDGNGGQVTAPPTLSGQMLVADFRLALETTTSIIANLNTMLDDLTSEDWIARRDAALDALSTLAYDLGLRPTPDAITTAAQANAFLAEIQGVYAEYTRLSAIYEERAALVALQTTLTTQLANIATEVALQPPMREAITTYFETEMAALNALIYAGFPGDIPTEIQTMITNINTRFAAFATVSNYNAFNTLMDIMEEYFDQLHAALDDHADFTDSGALALLEDILDDAPTAPLLSNLSDIADINATILSAIASAAASTPALAGLSATAAQSVITARLAAIATEFPDTTLQDRIDAIQTDFAGFTYGTPPDDYTGIEAVIRLAQLEITELNAALGGVQQIINLSSYIEAQLNFAVLQAQTMANELERRIAEIDSGREQGLAETYEDLLELLRGSAIADMQDLRDTISALLPPTDGRYTSAAALATLIEALQEAIDSGATSDFVEIINDIIEEMDDLPPGASRGNGITSNFKGIPFYMNQLNELVRTFARAMNEGLNRDGLPIDGAIGHINGFDANGENRQALFFTYETSPLGIGALLDGSDPLTTLRLWILEGPDGNPLRDPVTNDFITVRSPMPPTNVATDEMGRPMFTIDYSRFNALNFMVNAELLQDPALLAASSNQNIGQANNDVIHGFLAVGNDTSLFRAGRLIDFIIATSNHLAVDNSQAQLFREAYHEITMATHNHRLSVSSVDTEEEMLNLVRFQNMFIATSRLINVLDTVYDTLINRLGNF